MANQAIRQEINMTDAIITGTGNVAGHSLVLLDTTQYSGSPTYWFEACFNGAAGNTGTIQLTLPTTEATLNGATSATYITSRVQFTPSSPTSSYNVQIVGDGVRTQTLRSARIIILQNETTITQTETQIEIGSDVTGLTNTAVADITNPKFWKYTAANWDGTKTFYVEVLYATSAKNTVAITLCRTSDNATNTTIVSAGSNSINYTRERVSFTPVDGETYKIRALNSTTKSSYSIACAKIIVDQGTITGTALESYTTFTAGVGTAFGAGAASKLGRSWTTAASTVTISSVDLAVFKTGAPVDNLSLEIVSGSINGTVLATSTSVGGSGLGTTAGVFVNFPFGSVVTLSGSTRYWMRLSRSGADDGANFYRMSIDNSGGTDGSELMYSFVVSWSSGSANQPTDYKTNGTAFSAFTTLEPQFLLLNTADSNVTGNQTYLTTWNSSEWNAGSGTITYKHAMDSDNASNSAKIRDITASADISNSTVTGANQQVSSALGSFTDGNTLDVNVLNTTGVIAASRILVTYVFAAARRIFITGG